MDVKAAHQFSSCHRPQIEVSTTCGCFYCLKHFLRLLSQSGWTKEKRRYVPNAVLILLSGQPPTFQLHRNS